jgi:hypothetical protein
MESVGMSIAKCDRAGAAVTSENTIPTTKILHLDMTVLPIHHYFDITCIFLGFKIQISGHIAWGVERGAWG